MNISRHQLRLLSLIVASVMVLALALGAASGVSAQDEKVLIIGHAESTDSLDPARGYTQTTSIVLRATYSTLVTFPDEDASSIEPMLATSWEISEDGLSYTFTLRDDAMFASGEAVTADDVVFSINRLKNVKGSPSFLADSIVSVEAVDDSTVTFTLGAARPSFLSELTNNSFSITDADAIRANGGVDGEDAAEADTAEEFLNSNSVGTGPYILDHWDPQVETVLVRNPNYWGEQPYFDRVIITNIPEAATQKIALESGEIDMALDLTRDQVSGMNDPAISIFRGPSQYTHFLLMNHNPEIGGPVADPTVQLAIRYALDYEGYKVLWGGIAPASNLAYGLQAAWGEDKALTRDLDKARELLAEAGYPDGFDITLSYPDFTWQGVNMNTNAQKIQADLAEVGINVTLNPGELQVALEEYRTGMEGFGYWFWGPDVLDPLDLMSFLPGGKVALERANWALEDVDPEVQAMIELAAVETDPDARVELFGELQGFMQQSGAFAPFNLPEVQTAYRSDIQGYVFHPQWTLDVSILSRAE